MQVSRAAILAAMLCLLAGGLATRAGTRANAGAAASQADDAIILSGLPLPEGVRYGVALIPPAGLAPAEARVEVALPEDTVVLTVSEVSGRALFLGGENHVLTWAAPVHPAGELMDSLSFLLAAPLSSEARIEARWEGGGVPFTASFAARPELLPSAVSLQGSGLLSGDEGAPFIPVGESGVQISAADADALNGAPLLVERGTPADNPPAGPNALWWCAVLTLSGAPAGLAPYVLVPARQVLPGGMPVDLFLERDGSWEQMDQRGEATADGQYIGFRHPGGRVAAGLSPNFQSSTKSVAAPTPTPLVVRQPIGIPTPVLVGGEFVTAPTPLPTASPTRVPPTRTPAPVPKLSVTISGSTVVRTNDPFLYWLVTVKNTGNATAERVYVDMRGPSSPADWGYMIPDLVTTGPDANDFNCRILQGIALLGETRAECYDGILSPGGSSTFEIHGHTTLVVGSGTRTVKATAQNNFPNAATATGSASFSYAQNP